MIDLKAARIIGQELAKAHLQANARYLRLDVASALYGPSESLLAQATKAQGKARLEALRRKLPKGNRRIILVHRDEMERWIRDNFEQDAAEAKSPERLGKHSGDKANMRVTKPT